MTEMRLKYVIGGRRLLSPPPTMTLLFDCFDDGKQHQRHQKLVTPAQRSSSSRERMVAFCSSIALAALVVVALSAVSNCLAYSVSPKKTVLDTNVNRRTAFGKFLGTPVVGAGVLLSSSSPALASGGATAGKYTTIPIAKRRYYGRVQQAVHEFLQLGPAVVKGDMTASLIQTFFDPQGVVVVEAKRKDVNGQCTKKGGDCRGVEVRDSRWNDMKASMYLLGNAFRINQTKAPDNLPTVQAAKAFFKLIDQVEKRVRKNPKANDTTSQQLYLESLDILDKYLDLVELPPIESGHYEQEFSTLVGEAARIT